jgi:hypothetical protein
MKSLESDTPDGHAWWRRRFSTLAAALWWGSLTSTGFIAVPLLFVHLPTPALAGQTAARLFTAQTWIAFGCAIALMLASGSREARRMDWAQGALLYVLAGMLLAALGEFGVAPRIVARENLKLWHGIGSAMYLLQWGCAAIVLWKVSGSRSAALS